jgi:acyl-CoA thioesterase
MLSCVTQPNGVEAADTAIEPVEFDPFDLGPTEFDRTTEPRPTDRPGVFEVDLSDLWSSLVGMHGGYLTAIAVRAGELVESEHRVRTLTTSFLARAEPGPAEVAVAEVRRGRSITTLAVEVEQHGRAVSTTRLTLVAPTAGFEWSTPTALTLPPLEECVPITPPDYVKHFRRAEGLLDPSSLPFTGGERPVVRGYVRPIEARPIDAAWLAMISDWFPPPAFVRLDPPAGGISVDLTTHIHRTLPPLADDWLTASFEIMTSTGGLATEHGWIATTGGTLLAESWQTRWTAGG